MAKLTITVDGKEVTYKETDIIEYIDSRDNQVHKGMIEVVMPNYVIILNGKEPIIIHKSSLANYIKLYL